MTRKIGYALRVVPLVILLCLLLTGCECKHEWQAASCDTPKTCSRCQATEGEALGHTWADATCAAPKTCTGCGLTEGEALTHTWVDVTCAAPKHCSLCNKTEGEALPHTWEKATCTTAKTCTVCQATEGEALGHKWRDANCAYAKYCSVCYVEEGGALGHQWVEATTETPKTCSRCNQTEGHRIMTDSRFKTAFCKDLFGTWKGSVKIAGKDLVDEDFPYTLDVSYTVTFKNDGTLSMVIKAADLDNYCQKVETFMTDAFYKEFADQGYSKTQADALMKSVYGMDVTAYAKSYAADFKTSFDTTISPAVYYAIDSSLFFGSSWYTELQHTFYKLTDKTLTMGNVYEGLPDMVLTKS